MKESAEIIIDRTVFESIMLRHEDRSKGYMTFVYKWPDEIREWVNDTGITVKMICRLADSGIIEYGFGFDSAVGAVHFRLRFT